MKLVKVKIYPNMSASAAEEKINQVIRENRDPDIDISYELLIESSIRAGNMTSTMYTLLINYEEREEGD